MFDPVKMTVPPVVFVNPTAPPKVAEIEPDWTRKSDALVSVPLLPVIAPLINETPATALLLPCKASTPF